MKKRQSLSKGKSKRLFSKTSGTHKKNMDGPRPMRGGYRL